MKLSRPSAFQRVDENFPKILTGTFKGERLALVLAKAACTHRLEENTLRAPLDGHLVIASFKLPLGARSLDA